MVTLIVPYLIWAKSVSITKDFFLLEKDTYTLRTDKYSK